MPSPHKHKETSPSRSARTQLSFFLSLFKGLSLEAQLKVFIFWEATGQMPSLGKALINAAVTAGVI